MASSPVDGTPPQGAASAGEEGELRAAEPAADPWRLDPRQMPQRLSLDLPQPVLDRLRQLASRSGRSVDEIALDLIEAQLSKGQQS